jgi:integron integrase
MSTPLIPLSHLGAGPHPVMKLRFMDKVRRILVEHRYAERTAAAYALWIRRYIIFHGRRHPSDLDAEDVRRFLGDLAVRQRVSASTQNQALAALTFLYAAVLRRPLRPVQAFVRGHVARRIPVVLTNEEVRAVLSRLREPDRLIVSLLYGSGLRITECVSLRIKDVDCERREITVRGGKGGKDRRVPLAQSAVAEVERARRRAWERWTSDRADGVRVTEIPEGYLRKAPNADAEWMWYYLFPATRTFRDERKVERRHHRHQTDVQRAVREASLQAGLGKRVTCHVFRHTFATHLLESGTDIRTIQTLMGHASLNTTMIYTHVLNRGGLGVKSPADRL